MSVCIIVGDVKFDHLKNLSEFSPLKVPFLLYLINKIHLFLVSTVIYDCLLSVCSNSILDSGSKFYRHTLVFYVGCNGLAKS